ncbi:hypothetical protein [Actinomadura verrucosospora]|uniref:hypothetical protein n=1 Tax=Actinomadura verrucosospora TaxID=46165 RepID=UPI0015646136|nr:hypothetical protein [Actinomadura verrucosospora]
MAKVSVDAAVEHGRWHHSVRYVRPASIAADGGDRRPNKSGGYDVYDKGGRQVSSSDGSRRVNQSGSAAGKGPLCNIILAGLCGPGVPQYMPKPKPKYDMNFVFNWPSKDFGANLKPNGNGGVTGLTGNLAIIENILESYGIYIELQSLKKYHKRVNVLSGRRMYKSNSKRLSRAGRLAETGERVGGRLAMASKIFDILGIIATAADGGMTQWSQDKSNHELSGADRAARVTMRGAGAVVGGVGGAALGGFLGSELPGPGTAIGATVGGYAGAALGSSVAGFFATRFRW